MCSKRFCAFPSAYFCHRTLCTTNSLTSSLTNSPTLSTHQANYAIYFDIRVCDLKKDHLYSIYIHDYGQLTAGCESAGGQFGSRETNFNPILGLRTNPSGFIGSFKYNGENLNIQHFSKRLLLSAIIGRSIVVSGALRFGFFEENPKRSILLIQ